MVEGVTARRAENIEEAWQIMAAHEIPVMVDPDLTQTQRMQPTVVVDGRMLKKADSSLSKTFDDSHWVGTRFLCR